MARTAQPKKKLLKVQCVTGYHPGPVAPPVTDGASLMAAH